MLWMVGMQVVGGTGKQVLLVFSHLAFAPARFAMCRHV